MKRRFVISLLALLVISCSSQSSPEQSKNSNTLLWEISGNDLKQPSYFFGTMHQLCVEDAVISKNFQKVINKVDQIYFELDMDDTTQMLEGVDAMPMKGGKKLKDLYNEKDYEKVKNWFSEHGTMPFDILQSFKPMLLNSMFGETTMGCSKKDGMEFRIMELAHKRNLEIKGLETVAFRVGVLDTIPYEEQAKDLLETINNIESQKESESQIMATYKSQNLTSTNILSKNRGRFKEKYLDVILYDQNRRWCKLLSSIASEKSTLFAIEVGHLPGDNGIFNLLRKMGYTLTPLKN